MILRLSAAELAEAERRVAEACKAADMYAIVGAPTREGEKLFNSALVFSPAGKVIERYPELVRLPVLAGARVIVYVSHESGLREERKLGPYRAQIQARAVENTVFVVQANAPANKDATGSHGQSRIIAPDGNIIEEGTIFGEETLHGKLEIVKATRANAKNSAERGPLREWWREGMRKVRIID